MAISTPTLVTSGGDTVNKGTAGSEYTTAAVTLTAGRRYIIVVNGYRTAGGTVVNNITHDLAGTPLSFARIQSPTAVDANILQWDVAGHRTLAVWYVDPASTTASAAISIEWANSQSACGWAVFEIASGFDTGGNGAGGSFPQVVTATGSSTAPAVTLGSFGDANSLTWVAFGWGSGTSNPTQTISPTEGRTELDDHNDGERGSQATHYQNPNGSDTTVGGTLSATNDWGIIAIEIKAAAAAVASPYTQPYLQAVNRASNF